MEQYGRIINKDKVMKTRIILLFLLIIAAFCLIKKDNTPKYGQSKLVGEFYSPIDSKK